MTTPAIPDQTPEPADDDTAFAQQRARRTLPRLPVISFSLTIAAAGIALLFGILPARAATILPQIDIAVVLLFLPLAVLVLGIIAEAVRLSVKLQTMPAATPLRRPLSDWAPGRGEG